MHSRKYKTLACLFFVSILVGCGSTNSEETVEELTEASGNVESPSNPLPSNPLPSDVNGTLAGDLQVPMAALPGNPGLRTSRFWIQFWKNENGPGRRSNR